jgi:hypothetical protein
MTNRTTPPCILAVPKTSIFSSYVVPVVGANLWVHAVITDFRTEMGLISSEGVISYEDQHTPELLAGLALDERPATY